MMKSLLSLFLAFLGLMPGSAMTSVDWSSIFDATNVQSDGSTPLDGNFTFALGGFKNDFVPTAENVSEWAQHWCALEETEYREENCFFSDNSIVTSNEEPFRNTEELKDRVYIWGYNTLDSGGEWILISRPISEWSWPLVGDGPPLGGASASYFVREVIPEEVILGEVNAQEGVHMQTTRVDFGMNYDAWVLQNFTAAEQGNPLIVGKERDPDRDGISNLMEYAVGFDPGLSEAHSYLAIQKDVSGSPTVIELRVERSPLALVTWSLKASESLENGSFVEMTDEVVTVADSPDQLILRVNVDPESASQRFFRFSVIEN